MAIRPITYAIVVSGVLVSAFVIYNRLKPSSSTATATVQKVPNSANSTAEVVSVPASVGTASDPKVIKSEASAVTKFARLEQCINLPTMLTIHRRMADCGSASRPDPESQARYAACLDNTSAQRETVHKLEEQQKSCGGFDLTPGGLFAATRDAADQGDRQAAACFILGVFADRQRDAVGLPQAQVEAYPALASKYIQKGIELGDWHVIAILTQPVRFGSLLGSTNFGAGTPETEYKMYKLLQLGASKDFADTLEDRLANLAHEGTPPMTADAIAAAGQWAQEMYTAHFSGSARLDEMPTDGCADVES